MSVFKFNFIQTNREYFVLHNDNKLINNEYDICELKNLSKLISNLQISSSNDNISIEFYLDYEMHPIINDEMKIIYYNEFDIDNEELLKECDKNDEIAVILDYKSDNNNKNRDIIKYFQSKHFSVNILINHDDWISINNDKRVVEEKLGIELGDLINVSNFNILFYKILSNLKYRKTVNEIISLFQKFISHLKPVNFNRNIKEISDWQFQQLDNNIISNIKSIQNDQFENIFNIAKEEINKFVKNMVMENLDISDEMFSSTLNNNMFEDAKIKNDVFSIIDGFRTSRTNTVSARRIRDWFLNDKHSVAKDFLNYYAENKPSLMQKINDSYISKAKENLSDSDKYKEMLNDIKYNLQIKYCKSNIFLYQN